MSVRRAMTQTLMSRQATAVVGAVALVVLARLVTPEQFGIFAVAVSIYAVFTTAAGFGLKWRLVRAATADAEEIGSAFGLSLVLSAASAAMLFAAVLLVPGLAGTELRAALALLGAALLVGPFLLPLEAALERQIRFGLLSVLGAARAAVGAATGIALAWAGLGAAALAAAVLAERLATLVGLLIWGRTAPFPRPRLAGWRRFLPFGTNLTATQLIPKLGDAALMAVLAGLGGVAAAGLFNRAERVVKLFDETVLEGIKPVILPAFSRALDRGVPASDIYVAKVRHLAGVSWPAFATIAVLAEPIVAVLLGADWMAVVPVVQALALIGLAKPFTSMSLKFFVALDRTGEILRIHAAHQVLRLTLATAGATVSLEAASLGIAAALWVKAAVLGRAIKRTVGYDVAAFRRGIASAAGVTAATVAGPVALLFAAPDLPDLAQLVVGGALAGLGWVLGAALLRHPMLAELLLAIGANRQAAWIKAAP